MEGSGVMPQKYNIQSSGWQVGWRSLRRHDSVSSFVLTIGLVDLALGTVNQRAPLMGAGLAIVGIAIVLRVWRQSSRPFKSRLESIEVNSVPMRYLTGYTDRPLPRPTETHLK